MQNETRVKFNAYLNDVAKINKLSFSMVTPAGIAKFSVEPTIQQALENVIKEEVGFLDRISQPLVVEPSGERIGLDIEDSIASNTDTTSNDREPYDPTSLVNIDKYLCEQTNFDTALRYAKLDQWRKYPDFKERIARKIARQIGRDRIKIGWNGTHRAANSDRKKFPNLGDVAKGWIKKIEDNADERVLAEGLQATNEVRVGKGGDYNNIDALAIDLIEEKMAEHHHEDPDLVCIVGRQLLHDKYFGLVNNHSEPTERRALDVIMTTRQVGGLPAIRVPFFPKRSMLIINLKNLAIYIQEKSLRRALIENPKRDHWENYQSMNVDYMIEDYTALAYAKNIKIRTNNNAEENANWG